MISLFHECDPDCREYFDKDYPFEKWVIGDWKFKRCPKVYVTEDVTFWFYAYKMFKNGILPNPGGWLNQTNKFIEVMNFIDLKVAEFQKEKANGR